MENEAQIGLRVVQGRPRPEQLVDEVNGPSQQGLHTESSVETMVHSTKHHQKEGEAHGRTLENARKSMVNPCKRLSQASPCRVL